MTDNETQSKSDNNVSNQHVAKRLKVIISDSRIAASAVGLSMALTTGLGVTASIAFPISMIVGAGLGILVHKDKEDLEEELIDD